MFEQHTKAVAEWYRSLIKDSMEDRIAQLAEISGLGIEPRQLHYILNEIKICENLYDRALQYSPGYEETDLLAYFRLLEQFQQLEAQTGLPIEGIMAALYNVIQEVPIEEDYWTMDQLLSEFASRRAKRERIRIALRRGNIKRAKQLHETICELRFSKGRKA